MRYALIRLVLLGLTKRHDSAAPVEQRVDWAFGTAVIENPEVTREMVWKAARAGSEQTSS